MSDEKIKNQNIDATSEPSVKYRIRGGVDKPFLTIIILLLCAGIIMVATASYVFAGAKYGDNLYYFNRQLVFMTIGIVVMLIVSRIPYEVIRKWTLPIFGVALALMVLVFLIGSTSKGAQRWIQVGPVSIQPSEIMKFAVIILCADYIDRFYNQITLKGQPASFIRIVLPVMLLAISGAGLAGVGFFGKMLLAKLAGGEEATFEDGSENPYFGAISFLDSAGTILAILGLVLFAVAVYMAVKRRMASEAPDFFFGVLPFGILIVVVGALLALQPHMSGLIIMTLIVIIMMMVGGCSGRYLAGGAAVGAGAIFALLKLFPHSKGRLDVWHNPFDNLLNGGWQPAQSLYAIGNGGIWGVGMGQSMQKHLYLPEPMNDYIFAILCEEFGFIGAMAVILAFVFFVYRGIVIAFNAPDRFSSLVVLGIVCQVGLQALLNMMVVTNTIPSTGISLPFFSYGGSALVILLAEMGVVLSISRYHVHKK